MLTHHNIFTSCCVCVLASSAKAQFEEASRANELTDQLTQQSEYSASMGSACATLLWRVSRKDDAVETLLSGVSIRFSSCSRL